MVNSVITPRRKPQSSILDWMLAVSERFPVWGYWGVTRRGRQGESVLCRSVLLHLDRPVWVTTGWNPAWPDGLAWTPHPALCPLSGKKGCPIPEDAVPARIPDCQRASHPHWAGLEARTAILAQPRHTSTNSGLAGEGADERCHRQWLLTGCQWRGLPSIAMA